MRPFVHIAGNAAAWKITKEAGRGLIISLGVAAIYKRFISDDETWSISSFYKGSPSVKEKL